MPTLTRYLLPFAAGVAVGVVLHKYWPEIREKAGPGARRVSADGRKILERGRAVFWEQREKFADLVAEIRDEEEGAAKGEPPPPPAPVS